jgi:Arsenical resistance operon protein ArsD
MPKLEVFDPPMCCSTGVCGPSVDPTLVRFAADLEWLKSKGVNVDRCNLAQDPGAFVHHPILKKTLNTHGMKCLPLLVLDGRVIASGGYPSRKELADQTGLEYEPAPTIRQRQGDLVRISTKGK